MRSLHTQPPPNVLNQPAYEAHRDQPELVGTADVTETKLLEGLRKIGQDSDNRPGRLVEYLRDLHAGAEDAAAGGPSPGMRCAGRAG